MQRYFVPNQNWQEESVIISGDDAHHIQRVMRYNVQDEIICVHPNGQSAKSKITKIYTKEVKAKIIEWLEHDAELPVEVTIAQGLPKGNKLELILQKGTELGAARFCLFTADRSISKWNDKKSAKKLMRYRKIIKEASEQCHRNRMPVLEEPTSLEKLLQKSKNYDVTLFAYEEEAKTSNFSSFGNVLSEVEGTTTIFLCIGPEGGFSNDEVQLLKEHHFQPVRLGARILRTETASMYALASISYHFEELRCK